MSKIKMLDEALLNVDISPEIGNLGNTDIRKFEIPDYAIKLSNGDRGKICRMNDSVVLLTGELDEDEEGCTISLYPREKQDDYVFQANYGSAGKAIDDFENICSCLSVGEKPTDVARKYGLRQV